MPTVMADRVRETTTTTGSGTYNLDGAVVGFRSFVAGMGTGNDAVYCCTDDTDWEVGVGTVTDATPDTLSRTTILASSNGGSAVSWGAGTKKIFVTSPAAWLPVSDRLLYGPASSTDNAITRYDGTSGKQSQNSLVTIDDSGNMTFPAAATSRIYSWGNDAIIFAQYYTQFNGMLNLRLQNAEVDIGPNSLAFGASLGSTDCFMLRDFGPNAIGLRNGTNAQAFRVYHTVTNGSNYERGFASWENNIFKIGTEKAGTGSPRALELSVNGTAGFRITTAGIPTAVGMLAIDAGVHGTPTLTVTSGVINASGGLGASSLNWSNGWGTLSGGQGDAVVLAQNAAGPNGVSIAAGGSVRINVGTTGVITVSNACNFAFNTGTGSKICNATDQKMGFWNATPVVQQILATGSTTDQVITLLQTLGLCRQS